MIIIMSPSQICVVGKPGNSGPIYPTLEQSKWTINLYSSSVLTAPAPPPGGEFPLKVKVSFCQAPKMNDASSFVQVRVLMFSFFPSFYISL